MLKKLFLIFLLLSCIAMGQEVLTGDITSDMTLTSDKSYLLNDIVRVMSGATLTIDPGTIIYGENATEGSLIIEPGAKIMAEGTVASPIIFTSEFAKPGSSQLPERGDWGGVILLGNAPINPTGGTASIEGPGDTYGGTDPHDNSGVLKYVRIEYAGIAYSPNNEINALTFGGIGDGTTIDYVQASYSNDDSYEWFGGTVHCKHMIAYRGIDDDFDTDFGFQGKLQFLLGVRDPQVADVVSGSNGFESDNDGSGSLNAPRTSPEWWNVTLIGPQATTDAPYSSDFKRGMHLRRSSQNKVNNALIMGWPTGILIDGVQTTADAQNGVMFVKNSIVAGSSKIVVDSVSSNGTFDPGDFFSSNNDRSFGATAEILLRNPFNLTYPNCLPKAGSPVLTGAGTPPDDGFFDPTANYVGAFKDVDWTAGWAKFDYDVQSKEVVTLTGDITSDMTLTSDKSYLLNDIVRVMSGATLTIDPGTIIYGENATEGSLIIEPGAKIMAEGTVASPIIFTSEFAMPGSSQSPERGDWGGVILLGNAPINPTGGTASIEGPGDTYGGTDPHDNSGVIKYVRIEYAGVAYSPNNEINALTFGGIGDGTTIDYVQASYSNDDSYEWFGGTVHCKHMIAYRGIDDDFDTDYGFQGKLQFLLGVRDPQVADVVSGSNGFESDNDGSGSLNEPRTGPEYWNVTLVGPQKTTDAAYSSDFKRGMHLRRSSQNKVNNALILGWPTGILIDGVNTSADAENNVTFVKNSIIAGSSKTELDTASTNGQLDINAWFTNNSGQIMTNASDVMLTSPFDIENPNCMPLANSPALSGAGTPPDDGFFDPTANYIGAFKDVDWTFGWARFNPDSTTTGVKETRINKNVPKSFALSQNYPNPFNPTTKIQFSITKPSNVRLAIYNILGQEVSVLVNKFKSTGTYEVNFDASSLASGIYIYRLQADNQVVTKKMTLLK